MRRFAFFGGTFDPPHRGHLAIAKAAADRFALDEILFAPVATQPLKQNVRVTPFLHRYAMTALACQTDARFVPCLLDAPGEEESSGRPNYTVDTLDRLRRVLAGSPQQSELFALLGADSWLQIARWHKAPRLLTLADWIVASRPGFSLSQAESALPAEVKAERVHRDAEDLLLLHHEDDSHTRVFFLPFLEEDISATELRAGLDGDPADSRLLPAAVAEYIRKTGLYHPCAGANTIAG